MSVLNFKCRCLKEGTSGRYPWGCTYIPCALMVLERWQVATSRAGSYVTWRIWASFYMYALLEGLLSKGFKCIPSCCHQKLSLSTSVDISSFRLCWLTAAIGIWTPTCWLAGFGNRCSRNTFRVLTTILNYISPMNSHHYECVCVISTKTSAIFSHRKLPPRPRWRVPAAIRCHWHACVTCLCKNKCWSNTHAEPRSIFGFIFGSVENDTVSRNNCLKRSCYHLLHPRAASCCPRAGNLLQGKGIVPGSRAVRRMGSGTAR